MHTVDRERDGGAAFLSASAEERPAGAAGPGRLRKEDEPDGEPRFLMLTTVRDYALEQLPAAAERAARTASRTAGVCARRAACL